MPRWTLLAVLFVLLARPGAAQISPGPLARPHAELEGSRQCLSCHAGGRGALSANCLACHKDVGWLIERKRGYHAAVADKSCASCHPDHAGATFDLIKWPDGDAQRFDHARAGWPLRDKHAAAKCEACHAVRYRLSPAAALAAGKTGAGWTGLEQACVTCHNDPHRGALSRKCETCHGVDRWNATPGFDHARTRYVLTGKHVTTKCAACHLDPRLGLAVDAAGRTVPRYRPLAFEQCSDCHKDPHTGKLGPRCASCHDTRSFTVISAANFDHERTRYPLRGAHVKASCDGCHDFSGRAGARRSRAYALCTDCHRDVHAGQATLAGKVVDCAACHDVQTFTPARMTVAQHAVTRYPLTGRHAAVRCASCHTKSPAGSAVMRPAFARCRDCHTEDPHRLAATRDCRDCHDTRAFEPSLVDVASHERYFALDGAHRAIACADCHRDLRPTWRAKTPLPLTAARTCAGCHPGTHGTQFAARADQGRCDACHGTSGWRPADRFNHERTAFSLKGGHADVACARCHPAARPAADRRYRPVSAKCETCHGKEGR